MLIEIKNDKGTVQIMTGEPVMYAFFPAGSTISEPLEFKTPPDLKAWAEEKLGEKITFEAQTVRSTQLLIHRARQQ